MEIELKGVQEELKELKESNRISIYLNKTNIGWFEWPENYEAFEHQVYFPNTITIYREEIEKEISAKLALSLGYFGEKTGRFLSKERLLKERRKLEDLISTYKTLIKENQDKFSKIPKFVKWLFNIKSY